MDKQLKPCPFCGGDADKKFNSKKFEKWIECLKCGASSFRSDHVTYCIKLWNNRVEPIC